MKVSALDKRVRCLVKCKVQHIYTPHKKRCLLESIIYNLNIFKNNYHIKNSRMITIIRLLIALTVEEVLISRIRSLSKVSKLLKRSKLLFQQRYKWHKRMWSNIVQEVIRGAFTSLYTFLSLENMFLLMRPALLSIIDDKLWVVLFVKRTGGTGVVNPSWFNIYVTSIYVVSLLPIPEFDRWLHQRVSCLE